MSFLELIFSDLVFGLEVPLLVTAGCLLLSDEFKKFKAAKAFFYLATVWICGRVLMWSVFTSETFYTRALATFLAFGILGVGLAEALRATNHRENSLRNPKQEPPKPPPIQQKSEGANSPNIVGNNNTVTINMAPQPKLEGFREKVEKVSFSLGEGGARDIETVETLRKEVYEPFMFDDFAPVTLHMKGNVFLFHFKIWGGNGKPPVEVKDNEFIVRNLGYDRNSSANALEIVNADGIPLFQMIRKTPTDIVVNGVFPMPRGGIIIAGPKGMIGNASQSDLDGFRLVPIFKYPSWKYPGQYSDSAEKPQHEAPPARKEVPRPAPLSLQFSEQQITPEKLEFPYRILVTVSAEKEHSAGYIVVQFDGNFVGVSCDFEASNFAYGHVVPENEELLKLLSTEPTKKYALQIGKKPFKSMHVVAFGKEPFHVSGVTFFDE